MTDNVVEFDGITRLDIPAERILQRSIDRKLADAVVVGFDSEGDFYFNSSVADAGPVIYLLELAKKKLLEIGDAE